MRLMVRARRTGSVLLGVAVLVVALSALPAAGSPSLVAEWGTEGTAEGQFKTPIGVATDASGNVYVANSGDRRIDVFTSEGTFVRTWGWGVDDGSAALQVCTAGCESGISGNGVGQFISPFWVAIDAVGDVYVSDINNNRIQKFSASGAYLSTWGSEGTAEGQFEGPTGIAIDPSGNVYVGDTYNHRVQKFDATGAFLRAWGWGVDDGAYAFQICTSSCQAGQGDYGDGGFASPHGIAIGTAGDVFVADTENHRIQRFTTAGLFQSSVGEVGQAPGDFYYPWDIEFDVAGNAFVVDAGNQRIEKFDPSLDVRLASWGRAGIEPGEFATPLGIAVDASGSIYVSDAGNNRIQKFGPATTMLSVKAPRKVSAGTKAVITGALTSGEHTCVGTQTVTLRKGDTSLATAKTSATGTFRFALKVRHKVTVHVTYDGSVDCGPADSAPKTITVT
jgi:tripartite motif-containing protein 71